MAKSSSAGFFTVLKYVLYVMVSVVLISVVLRAGCVSACVNSAPQVIGGIAHSISSATK
jgi:chemotaxis receptor (MCP) glutamine deamidase CheD